MFEEDVCVDLDGKPNYANITFSELFARRCVDQPEVMDKGPDYATALILEFCAGARCPPMLTPSRDAAVEVYSWEKESLQAKRFRFFSFFHFFFFMYS